MLTVLPATAYNVFMSTTVEAIYISGKLVLQQPLPLKEQAHVRVTIQADEADLSDDERAAWLKVSEQSSKSSAVSNLTIRSPSMSACVPG